MEEALVGLKGKLKRSIAGFSDIMLFDNRWEIVIRRILFRRTGIITYRKGGMEIVVDHHGGDEVGTRACLVSSMYRDFLPRMALEGQLTVLDIGANGGGFPLMLADAGFMLRKVVAVEMNPRTYARMQLNIQQNLDAETVLLNAAVCGEARNFEAAFGRGSTGESIAGSLGASSHGSPRTSVVPGMTFDQVFEEAFDPSEIIDICKIDIEGSEYDVFRSTANTALARCRYLLIEIHAVKVGQPTEVSNAIIAHGFNELPRLDGQVRDVYLFKNSRLI